MLTKYIQIGPVLTVLTDFAQRSVWGFEPPHFIFHLNVFSVPLKLPSKLALRFKILHLIEMTGAKYLSIPSHFCEKAPFPTLLMVLLKSQENLYINISCSSLF